MSDLADLTKEDFEKCKGQAFQVDLETDELPEDFRLEVKEVESLTSSGEQRQSFSVVFKGPKQPVLQQAAIPLRNQTLGQQVIFLVPVGQDEESTFYEAVFA